MNPGSKYVPLLDPSLNNGTTAGGLGHALQMMMQGLGRSRSQREQMAANQAMIKGMKGWDNPDTPEVESHQGGLQGGIAHLSGLQNNPYAAERASSLMMAKAQSDAQLAQRKALFEQEQELKPPTIQTFQDGRNNVQKRWDAPTRSWVEVGRGPMDAPPKPPQDPSGVREYQFAVQQGYRGSFEDWQLSQRKAGAATVQVGSPEFGSIPPGYMLQRDANTNAMTMVPVPGSPAAREIQEAQEAGERGDRQRAIYADIVTEDIDRIIERMDKASVPVTGRWSFAKAFPATAAADVSNLLDTIRANAGFDRLQEMRAASPTGGALGQVSENENRLLQATIGSLEQSQSEEQFRYNLSRVKDLYLDIIHGPGNRPEGGADSIAPPPGFVTVKPNG